MICGRFEEMGTRMTCDYKLDGTTCGKPARHTIEALNSNRGFRVRACNEHIKLLESELLAMGFTPFAKTGDKERKSYVSDSGVPFSTNEAREWLQKKGYDVPIAGRLSGTMLKVYAENH